MIFSELKKILAQAKWLAISSRSALLLALMIFCAFSISALQNYLLRQQNENFINNFINLQRQKSIQITFLKNLELRKNQVTKEIRKLSTENNLSYLVIYTINTKRDSRTYCI